MPNGPWGLSSSSASATPTFTDLATGSAAWGSIAAGTGLASQGDLWAYLNAIAGKEPAISAGPSASYFWKGNKTWATLASGDVTSALGFTPYNGSNPSNYIALASAITGYTAGSNVALAATDTLLAALGKLQGQISNRQTVLGYTPANRAGDTFSGPVGFGGATPSVNPVVLPDGAYYAWKNAAGTTEPAGIRYTDATGKISFYTGGADRFTVDGSGNGVLLGGFSATTGTFSSTVTAVSFNGITGLSSTSPAMDGTATVGTSATAARGDHAHPSDTSRLWNAYLLNQSVADANTITQGVNVQYLNGTHMPGSPDFALFTQAYNTSWATQLASDWRTNNWYTRGLNNGTWSTWATILSTANLPNNAAAIQAVVASLNAPMVGTHAQMIAYTPTAGSTPYWYATDDTASDGLTGKLWHWNGSSWVATGAEASIIVGRITAGLISAGAIGAQALAAAIALLGIITSTTYTAGTSSAVATGFKISGPTFTATFLDGTSAPVVAEFGGNVSIGGWKAVTVGDRIAAINRISNGSFFISLAGWTLFNAGMDMVYNGTYGAAGVAGCMASTASVVATAQAMQPFNMPKALNALPIYLVFYTGCSSTLGNSISARVRIKLHNAGTGVTCFTQDFTYTGVQGTTPSFASQSIDVTSYVAGGGEFVLQIDHTVVTPSGDTVTVWSDNFKLVQ